MEQEWVGKIDEVDAKVYYGQETFAGDAGPQAREVWVDGWLLPVYETKREESCEFNSRPRCENTPTDI